MKHLIVLLALTVSAIAQVDYRDASRDTVVTRIVPADYTDRLGVELTAEECAALYRTLGTQWRKELRAIVNGQIRMRVQEVRGQVLAEESDEPRTGTKAAIRQARSEAIRTINKSAKIGMAGNTDGTP